MKPNNNNLVSEILGSNAERQNWVVLAQNIYKDLWDHSFSTYTKCCEKLTFLTPPICTRTFAYTGVWNVRLSEYFASVLNEWTLRALKSLKSCRIFHSRWNQFRNMSSQIFCRTPAFPDDICICSFERWLKIWFAWALSNKIPAFADPDNIWIWYFESLLRVSFSWAWLLFEIKSK